MVVAIKKAVGYRAANNPDDVRAIHDLLNRIPSADGGPPVYFNPSLPYNPTVTDVHILSFQNRWFTGNNCDAVVSPGGQTLAKMNQKARSEYTNRPFVSPANVVAAMTKQQRGTVQIKGFSRSKAIDPSDGRQKHFILGLFEVPLYVLKVGIGTCTSTAFTIGAEREYLAVRFAVRYDEVAAQAGRPHKEWFEIVGPPKGDFALKRNPYAHGSWLLKGDFLIHVGPIRGSSVIFGGLGCIQPVDGGMRRLDEQVREYSFSDYYRSGFVDAAEADRRITQAGSFHCFVEHMTEPPKARLVQDLTHVGGPAAGTLF